MKPHHDIPRIDTARCTGCGRCVAACSPHLISLETSGPRKYAALNDSAQCTLCRRCAEECLVGAVTVPEAAQAPDRSSRHS